MSDPTNITATVADDSSNYQAQAAASPNEQSADRALSNTLATVANGDYENQVQGTVPALSKRMKSFMYIKETFNDISMMQVLGKCLDLEDCKTAAQKAAALKMSKASMATLLKGQQKPQNETVKKCAEWLGVSFEDFTKMLPAKPAEKFSKEDVKHAIRVLTTKLGEMS